jgi:hypothetical protein
VVSVSIETPAQTDARLRKVIGAADFVVHPGVWQFEETALTDPPALSADVLAVVRDDDTWSRLVPARGERPDRERFGLFSFHFPDGMDNSGFVGWLATQLKQRLGTGVFVVCGSNRTRGGIYDYWGCPVGVLTDALAVVRGLRGEAEGTSP